MANEAELSAAEPHADELGPAADHDGHTADSPCVLCRLDRAFDLPSELVERAIRREVVIFAGAGISTEVPQVFPSTVLEMARKRLGAAAGEDQSFPEVMSQFEAQFGKTELVRMIKRKFDYIDCYPFIRNAARKFHYELATMPYLAEIVTTNWDTFFEEECGAVPIVTGEDIAFYGMPGRKVLKVHGSIAQVGSLTITEEDYANRLERLRSDLMGGLLRSLLATKTVVFVGYSLKDWNFRRFFEALRGDMGQFTPKAYVVDPFTEESVNEYGMQVLRTSGVHFLRQLKRACVGHCVIGDEVYPPLDDLWEQLELCNRVAKEVSVREYPAVLYTWFYHDGIRDALSRVSHRSATGEYSDRHGVTARVQSYGALQDQAEKEERWDDYAYIDGYLNVLMLLLDDEYFRAELSKEEGGIDVSRPYLEMIPLYFVFGSDSEMRTEEDFKAALDASRRRSPKTRRLARELTKDFPEGMVTHHEPFLSLAGLD